MKLSLVDKLALHVVGWAAVAALSFFFHVVAFVAVLIVLASRTLLFRFVYLNTKESHEPTEPSNYPDEYIPELGSDWERSVRADLSESESGRNKGDLG